MYEAGGRGDAERFCVHDEIEIGRIVGVESEMISDESQTLILFVVDAVRGFFQAQPLGPAQSFDPPDSRFHDENAKRALGGQSKSSPAAQNHTHAAIRKSAEDAEKLGVVLRFGVMRKATKAVANKALDRVSHALVETFDEVSRHVSLSGDLIDDLAPEEAELEIFRDEAAEFSSPRAWESRERDAGAMACSASFGLLMGPSPDLTIDHLVEGVGGRTSHGVTSEPIRPV